MTQPTQQYQTTIALADAALGKIGALGQPADPRSYALWFKYASGDSGLLSAAINTRLARNGTLTASDIEELHGAHIAPGRVQNKTDRISTRMQRAIFAADISLEHKMHLRYFVERIDELANEAEDIADSLAIFAIKRQF